MQQRHKEPRPKQLRLGSKRELNMTVRQIIGLAVVKRVVGFPSDYEK
jgi:hypothetical protein